jgi:hypothetical protein
MGGAHNEPGKFAELHRVYLDASMRGKGLGARLCERLEEWARGRGARRMLLWSDFRFTHGHTMYRERGYRVFGSREIADPDRSVEYGMERDLARPAAPPEDGDSLTGALRGSIRAVPLEKIAHDSSLWRRAQFAAAGIVDPRTLLSKGKPVHELPHPSIVFGPDALKGTAARIDCLVGDTETVVGFRRALGTDTIASIEEVIHPSCRLKP